MVRTRWYLVAPILVFVFVVASCAEGDSTEPQVLADTSDPGEDISTIADAGMDFSSADDIRGDSLSFDVGTLDVGDICTSEPGTVGCPCKGNSDCLSGYCVQATGGSVCTMECLEECPFDWTCTGIQGFGVDLVFLCIPELQAACGAGDDPGLLLSCSQTYPPAPEPGEPFVACYGFQECTPTGWSDCLLPEEVCDNLDNNCDGQIDEEFVDSVGDYFTLEHCGECNNNCSFLDYPNAESFCDADLGVPGCDMKCLDGFFDLNNNPEDGCECEFVSATDYPDGIDQNCDGADGDISNALFVAKNGDDGNSGAIDQPLLTIKASLEEASASGKRDVYVASGVYAESVALVQGVGLYGGYSSDFTKRNIDLNVTVIMGQQPSPAMPGAVNAASIAGEEEATVIDGFTVFGRNNMSPGGTTYALYVRNSGSGLRISQNTIEAGSAGPGAKGSDGTNGAAGLPGGNGLSAFGVGTDNCNNANPSLPRPGGAGGEATCDEGSGAAGGTGGGNTCPQNYGEGPSNYENGFPGEGTGGGDGGPGGYDREVWYCAIFPPAGECHQAEGGNETGNTGSAGANGTGGETAGGNGCLADSVSGSVVDGLWAGGSGLTGKPGIDASGGGGGGSGGGAQNASSCSGRTHIGGTGAGGGSGGCSGSGGDAGGSGGGSFGIFITWDDAPDSSPVVSDNTVIGGIGGAGGQGGNAGSGGPGGAGGMGGGDDFANAPCSAPGGNGGSGGLGGHGEGGGGGCGGPSTGLFINGQGSLDLTGYANDNTFAIGAGGLGGSGGPSIGNPGDTGASGTAASTNL
jgi:hypothetical protein